MSPKKITKAFLLTALSVLAFSQAGYAATFNLEAAQDFILDVPAGYVPSAETALTVKYMSVSNKLVSLLKFDTSSLKGETITAASFNINAIFGFSLTPPAYSTPVSLYYVSNDTFINESTNITAFSETQLFDMIGYSSPGVLNNPLKTLDVKNQGEYNFTFNAAALDKLIADVATSGDNEFSLLLKTDALYGNADFVSRHNKVDFPVLEVQTTPAPEPSSMVLGLMGLGSMLGLRRKKA